jgi:hypothetical protein
MKYITVTFWIFLTSCGFINEPLGKWCGSSGPTPYAIGVYIEPNSVIVKKSSQDSIKIDFDGQSYDYYSFEYDSILMIDADSNVYYKVIRNTDKLDSLITTFGDTFFEDGDVARKYKSGETDICYYEYSSNFAITDTITNISLITLQPFGEYSEQDTLNQNLDIEYSQWANFISSGYTLEAYNNANKTIPLDQFNQQKNILVDSRFVTLHFKSPLLAGSYNFQIRYSTARGKVLTKDLDIEVE